MCDKGHPKSVLCDKLEGRGGEGGRRGAQEGGNTHVFPWLIHVDVWRKPSQYHNYPPIINFFKKLPLPTAAAHSNSV